MAAFGLELVGVTLSVLGWLLSIVCCALPMWRVTAFIGTNIVTAQVYWEGIWMSCVVQSTGQMQCKVYDSMLALSADLQAARALVVVSIIVGVVLLFVCFVVDNCGNCIEDEGAKARVMISSGAAFITAAVMQLIPVSWSAHTIILEFYSPVIPEAQKMEIGAMSMGMELGGIALGIIGWIISIVTCALPMWRVSAFVGANIVTAQVIWEGLWMNCVVQSTGQMQCKVYDSMLALSQDLQASRAMSVISIILAILGVLISIMGAKCTNCIEDEASKAKVMIISGVMFIIAGILELIPVAWVANQTIRDFYNPLLSTAQQRELGASIYIGFAAAALLLIGGALLCCTCPPREKKYKPPRWVG
ncbi:claudin-4-like isoform X2 [Cyprinus carpio]|uniref:Claudin-4-like isoform X2 n=2 Tax=Cyprinus carpio TaxID=7962 RepID=A0A9Q9VLJ1_CYPCA|nr:claudin-4-like isoform X2 [Cyprinus carpio]